MGGAGQAAHASTRYGGTRSSTSKLSQNGSQRLGLSEVGTGTSSGSGSGGGSGGGNGSGEGAPSEDAPNEDAPGEGAPGGDSPAEDSPAEDSQVEDAPERSGSLGSGGGNGCRPRWQGRRGRQTYRLPGRGGRLTGYGRVEEAQQVEEAQRAEERRDEERRAADAEHLERMQQAGVHRIEMNRQRAEALAADAVAAANAEAVAVASAENALPVAINVPEYRQELERCQRDDDALAVVAAANVRNRAEIVSRPLDASERLAEIAAHAQLSHDAAGAEHSVVPVAAAAPEHAANAEEALCEKCCLCDDEEIYCDAGLCEGCCHGTSCWINHTHTSSEDEDAHGAANAEDEDAHGAASAEDAQDDLERRMLIEAEVLRRYAKQRAEGLPRWGEAPADVEMARERAELARDAAAAEDAGDAAAGEDEDGFLSQERLAVIARRSADQPDARQVAENFQCRKRSEARAYRIMEEGLQERAVDDEAAAFRAQMETARRDSCITAASLLIRHRHQDPNAADGVEAELTQGALKTADAQLEAARRDSCITAASLLIRHRHHGPNAADRVEAELVQGALRTADAAEEEAIAARLAADAAFAAQLAADDVGAAEAEDSDVGAAQAEDSDVGAARAEDSDVGAAQGEESTVMCRQCCRDVLETEMIQLNCSTQRSNKCKMCNKCFYGCAGKCPFCKGKYRAGQR